MAQLPGYADVNSWLFDAVPKLSEYMVIPDSRMMHVRFRLASSLGEHIRGVTGKTVRFYLYFLHWYRA